MINLWLHFFIFLYSYNILHFFPRNGSKQHRNWEVKTTTLMEPASLRCAVIHICVSVHDYVYVLWKGRGLQKSSHNTVLFGLWQVYDPIKKIVRSKTCSNNLYSTWILYFPGLRGGGGGREALDTNVAIIFKIIAYMLASQLSPFDEMLVLYSVIFPVSINNIAIAFLLAWPNASISLQAKKELPSYSQVQRVHSPNLLKEKM